MVDLYSTIAMNVRDWISPYDGPHPIEAVYREIALDATTQDQAKERSVYRHGEYPSDSAAARISSATSPRRRYSSFASVA